MDKDGVITVTHQDLEEYYEGNVSKRIKDLWDLTFEELRSKIQLDEYTLV